MSGLETLGAICSILQTVSFARKTASQCYKFYNDTPIDYDALHANAEAMNKATISMRSELQGLQGGALPNSRDLLDILQRFGDIAQNLMSEVSYVLAKRKPGSAIAMLRTQHRYLRNKAIIATLRGQIDEAQQATQLLLAGYNISQAQLIQFQHSQSFASLSKQIQTCITDACRNEVQNSVVANSQLLADFVALLREQGAQDHEATRKLTEQKLSENYNREELKEQSRRLLNSFKFPEMWDRQELIAESPAFDSLFSDSNVYGSFSEEDEEMNEEIDIEPDGMQLFYHWVKTGGSLFWIKGRVASGKSTLVKYLAQQQYQSPNDEMLSDSETEILSYYFWRPGTLMQKNLKGMLCSLIFQLLEGHQARVNEILLSFPVALRNDDYRRWKLAELQEILNRLLEEPSKKFILFIDGLDEIEDNDELTKVLNTIELRSRSRTARLCVSSRPEWIIYQELKDYPNISLEKLTRGSMMLYCQQALGPAMAKKGWHAKDQANFHDRLVHKADGVFFWLTLTATALRICILQEENRYEVEQRLDELPDRLEEVFADMWNRMGKQFEKSAATYLNLLLAFQKAFNETQKMGSLSGPAYEPTPPNLVCLLLAAYPDITSKLLTGDDLPDKSCNAMDVITDGESDVLEEENQALGSWIATKEKEVRIRLKGILVLKNPQLRDIDEMDSSYYSNPRNAADAEVHFAHRSVYDFFTKTEKGISIRALSPLSQPDCYFQVARALVVSPLSHELPFMRQHLHVKFVSWKNRIELAVQAVRLGLSHDTACILPVRLLKLCQDREKAEGLGVDFSLSSAMKFEALINLLKPYTGLGSELGTLPEGKTPELEKEADISYEHKCMVGPYDL